MPISPDAANNVANGATPLPGVATGGQPTPEQLEQLKAAGVKVVVDLRDPMEQRPFDEPAKVRETASRSADKTAVERMPPPTAQPAPTKSGPERTRGR